MTRTISNKNRTLRVGILLPCFAAAIALTAANALPQELQHANHGEAAPWLSIHVVRDCNARS